MSERNRRDPFTQMGLDQYASMEDDIQALSYSIQMGAYSHVLDTADRALTIPSLWPEDIREGESLEAATERFITEHPGSYYSQKEKEKLRVPTQNRSSSTKLAEAFGDDLEDTVSSLKTDEEVREQNMKEGILSGQICLALGREYEKWLAKFPPDDPNREQKAFYLTAKDNESQANMLLLGLKDLEVRKMRILDGQNITERRKGTFLKDLNELKKMSMSQYFDKLMYTDEQRKTFIQNHNDDPLNTPVSASQNAYDYFMGVYEREVSKGLEKEGLPEDEQRFADFIYRKFYQDGKESEQRLGQNLAISQMPEAQQKTAQIGAAVFNVVNYSEPKEIKNDIPALNQMLLENRIESINTANENLSKAVTDPENASVLDVKQASSILKPAKGGTKLDQYLQKHMGFNAIKQSPEKRRMHLAKAMAAAALKDQGKPYDISAIHKMAEKISSKTQFQDLTDEQVSKGLMSMSQLTAARKDLTEKMFGVPKAQQAEYINQMKLLHSRMVGPEGSSDKYKDLVSAVGSIGALDPNDPQIDAKLMAHSANMMNAIETYAKGKKSVRTFQDGKDKFDNCLDALAIVDEHVPGLSEDVNKLVDKTNKVRKAGIGDKDYVNLGEYGAERAKEAMDERKMRRQDSSKQKENEEQKIQL